MNRLPLDTYDRYPKAMRDYLGQHGWHFSRKACEKACSKLWRKGPVPGTKQYIQPYTREEVDALLAKYGIQLENSTGYDYVYVANMCKADYLKQSVPDEHHLCMYVRDVIDDADAGDGTVMRGWYAAMVAKGEPVDWEEIM